MTVANGLTSIYNNSKAYDAMQNENPAWAMRYVGRDTLTEQMIETSDSKLVHNLATGLDVLETSAGLILFAKDGMDALKSIKNFTGKCKILGNGGINLLDDAAELGVKSADGIPNNSVVDNVIDEGSQAAKPYTNSRPNYSKGQVDQVWENAKDPVTGKVYDPSGAEITWDTSKPRNGQWDMGHIPGEKYSDMHELYMNGTISKKEFLEWYRNHTNYRPEFPSTNRGHQYE